MLGLGFFFIDIDKELGLGDAKTAEQADEPLIAVALIGQVLNASHEGAQASPATILNLELESSRGAQAVYRRGAEHTHAAIVESGELLSQPSDNLRRTLLRDPRSIFKGFQNNEHAADVADVGAEHRGISRQVNRVSDSFFRPRQLRHFLDHLVRAIQCRPVR